MKVSLQVLYGFGHYPLVWETCLGSLDNLEASKQMCIRWMDSKFGLIS
jgi:hypothetical protein